MKSSAFRVAGGHLGSVALVRVKPSQPGLESLGRCLSGHIKTLLDYVLSIRGASVPLDATKSR